MSASKHTAGPWRYAETWRPPVGRLSTDRKRDATGNVFWGYHISGSSENGAAILPTLAAVHNFPEQMEANARLIAAAPDLLEALDGLMRCEGDAASSAACGLMDCVDNSGRYYQSADLAERIAEARAAIAKATGADQ